MEHNEAQTPEALAEIKARHEASETFINNGGGFRIGEVVRIIGPGLLEGAVGEVECFDPSGFPAVHISGIVGGAPVNGLFVIEPARLKSGRTA